MAQGDQKTVLVDADLRRPAVHTALKIQAKPGLSEVIKGERVSHDVIRGWKKSKLDVIAAGPRLPNVTEIAGSKRIGGSLHDLKENYEVVIVDAPPLYRTKQFRFIGAHLESRSASRNIREGLELLSGPANTALPVIIAADLNCDLSNPADTKYPTCLNLLKAGFSDAWSAANPTEPGYTKHLPLMTMRGDYVMVRGRFRVQAAVLVGDKPDDMTPSGRWPSNHCGVVARLQLPGAD